MPVMQSAYLTLSQCHVYVQYIIHNWNHFNNYSSEQTEGALMSTQGSGFKSVLNLQNVSVWNGSLMFAITMLYIV